MSDSEEDFASADEGELEPTAAESSKVQTQESPPVSEKAVPEDKQGKKAVETLGTKKKSSENASTTRGNASKHNKSRSKGPETSADGPAGRNEKTRNKSESGASSKGVDEKTKQKSQVEKKGKQKSGKAKQNKKATQLDSKDADNSADSKNSALVKERVAVETENSDKVKSESSEFVDSDKNQKADGRTETIPVESPAESANKPAAQSEGKTDLITTPEKETSSDSKENLTLEQKEALIKSPSSQSITRPEPDHTDKQEDVLDKLAAAAKEKKSGWGWGWGSSLLEVASSSVSTFTSQVGEGLHTVMETVESTLNVPDPEELAQRATKQTEDNQEEDDNDREPEESDNSGGKTNTETGDQSVEPATVKQTEETETAETQSSQEDKEADNQSGDGWFSAWGVSNITKMVENTGKTLVTGSLDVLETLGKKTFDVLNEHDPGLKKARAFLHDRGDKPNLSATLRDAKELYETHLQHEKESEEARKAHFGSLFDDFQGLAHLEALEMLSNQSEKRVNVLLNALPAEAIATLKPQLLEIKQNFEIEDDEDEVTEQEFALLVTDLLKELNVGTSPDKILASRNSVEEKVTQCSETDELDVKDVHQIAISSLAELTSKCIEQFHKAGELILIQKSTADDFTSCSNTLLRLTKVLTAEVGILSTKFSDCLNKHEGDEIKVSHLVTNIYLEASNSSTYIQDGFQLLLPVLQQATIERSQEPVG